MAVKEDKVFQMDEAVLGVHGGAGIAVEQALGPGCLERRPSGPLVQPRKRFVDAKEGVEDRGIERIFRNLIKWQICWHLKTQDNRFHNIVVSPYSYSGQTRKSFLL